MNLIPPITATPVGALPGNGLEPGDNPLAGIEDPIFYEEFVAALSKGAGGEGAAVLAGSPGESTLAEGESPEGELQGLPAEVTSQLVDQANFSLGVHPSVSAIVTNVEQAPVAATAVGTISHGALAITAQNAAQASEAASAHPAQQLISQPQGAVEVGPQAGRSILTAEAQATSATAAAKTADLATTTAPGTTGYSMVIETNESPMKPSASVPIATGSATTLPSGATAALAQDISARADLIANAPAVVAQVALDEGPPELRGSSVPTMSGVSMRESSPQAVSLGSTDATAVSVSQGAPTTNTPTRINGSIVESVTPAASVTADASEVLGSLGMSSSASDLAVRAPATLSSRERGTSFDVTRSEDWQGLIAPQSAGTRAVAALSSVSEVVTSEGSLEVSLTSQLPQAPAVTDGNGDWRFPVRPNSSSPVDAAALPADVAIKLQPEASPALKGAAELASTTARVTVIESQSTLDPITRASLSDAVVDVAMAEASRTDSGNAVAGIARQSASSDSQTALNNARADAGIAAVARDVESGSPNSIAEKFISTLLGMSGTQVESAADRTAIEFRQAKTIVSAPHMARWDAAAVQVELVRMVRDGGGQVVMKLTPPDEGSFRIDLSLDPERGVRIFVEGASDSVRTRLEQGAEQLREQFSQMGFNLQLDMHSRREAFAQSGGFGFTPSDEFGDSGSTRNVGSEVGADVDVAPTARRRSIVDESQVYFRA